MPGNVSSAAPSSVMPQTLCLQFEESRDYAQIQNTYHDGSREFGQLAQTSRRSFKLSKRLTAAALSTLRTFWVSVNGGLTPFYFYNPFEATPVGSNYDATGVSTTGRVTVAFRGDWSQVQDIGRHQVPNISLIEVA